MQTHDGSAIAIPVMLSFESLLTSESTHEERLSCTA